MRAYVARIAELDAAGPALRSVIAINPHALPTRARPTPSAVPEQPPGPLAGIPILIKDNIESGRSEPDDRRLAGARAQRYRA